MKAADPRGILPVGLRLRDRPCVVVGGGRLAHRGVAGLLEIGARVTVISPELTPALEALATGGALYWTPRPFERGDLAETWYAVAATGIRYVDDAVAAEAEARRVFCDRGEGSVGGTAIMPATGRHGGHTISIHSDERGHSDDSGDSGDNDSGDSGDNDSGHRDDSGNPDGGIHNGGSGHPNGDRPRRATGLRDAIMAALMEGTLADRAVRPARSADGGIALVGGGPGDPGLLTLRGRQLLNDAEVVIADHLAPQSVLASLSTDVLVIDASKLPQGRSMAQQQINDLLVEHARAGRRVVRLKGGDPFVFGRGMEEVQACAAAGLEVEVVPGVSSAVAVPAMAGIPVTHRGMAHEFVVVSGHLPPDHPESLVDWTALGRLRGTLVVLMGVHNAGAIAAALIEHGRPPDTRVSVICNGGLAGERVLTTELAQLATVVDTEDVRPPAVLVVGEVVSFADER